MITLHKYKQVLYVYLVIGILWALYYLLKPSQDEEKLRKQELIETSPSYPILNLTIKYLLNNEEVCQSSRDIDAIFIITSYFGDVETRQAIRQSFKDPNMKRVFLLGKAADPHISQHAIEQESREYNDIVQGNFTEAYKHLIYKHIMGLKWAGTYCRNAKFVIKMDDDTVVNMHQLPTILKYLETVRNKHFIAGYKLVKLKPIRDLKNKWFVSLKEYSGNIYPPFVSGWFYVTTPKVAGYLATIANFEQSLWIDDLFVTGILSKRLQLTLYDISQYFTPNSEYIQCCLQGFKRNIDCDIYVGPNGGDLKLFFEFNENARKCTEHGLCKKREKLINESCVAEKKVNLGWGEGQIKQLNIFSGATEFPVQRFTTIPNE